ncbi:c2H2-type domain-containing protein [Trichonephila clavata]|uniref:C2H2-type domain-containing protein n=1 Tax=Trichonephila clavata TaxID=2740835 RepID=A0A8X6JMG9_TRICU|nr:c2H2-type domain-containing protein [Trichonephila clavata]
MAGVHEKTCKSFSDDLKKSKYKINLSDLMKEGIIGKTANCYSTKNKCPYCSKFFINSKYLSSHIFRKHSNDFIEMHGKVINFMKSYIENCKAIDLLDFMKGEFSHVKGEIEMMKKLLLNHLEGKNDELRHIKYDCEATQCKSSDFMDTDIRSKSFELSKVDSEVNARQILPTDFQSLKAQANELQIIQEMLASKDDVEKSVLLSEERIYKKLKGEFLIELQELLVNHQKENRTECEKYFLEMKKDIFRLEKAVELNSKKIDSSEYLQDIQKKFEHRLQNLLKSHSKHNLNLKEGKTNQIKKTENESKLSLIQKINRRKKSIYTSNSQYARNSDVSLINKNEGPHSSFNFKKNKSSECAQEFNSLSNSFENVSNQHMKEAELVLEEKLKSLNVNPHADKLSYGEFEKKMRLVNSEKEILDKKYDTFSKARDNIDSYVNKLVKSKLRKKFPKKISFSDSPDIPSCEVSDIDSCFKGISAKKQESSGFILPSVQCEVQEETTSILDRNSNSQNTLQTHENVDISVKEANSFFPRSSVELPNDRTFIKEFSPANWPNYCTDNNNSIKKSIHSVSEKLIEEISDLSSLESDTFED